MKDFVKIYNTQAEYDAVKKTLLAPYCAWIRQTNKSYYIYNICDDTKNKPFMDVMRAKSFIPSTATKMTIALAMAVTNMQSVFQGNANILDLTPLKYFGNVTNFKWVAINTSNLTKIHFPRGNKCNNYLGAVYNANKIETIDSRHIKDVTYMFDFARHYMQYPPLKTLDTTHWNLSNCTSIASIFEWCPNLEEIDSSNWNISATCTSTAGAFKQCLKLRTIGDTTNWNLSKVTTAQDMFINDKLLESLNVQNWNMGSCTIFMSMFEECKVLDGLDVSNWDVSKATSLAFMFSNCNSLSLLDVSNWNVSSVKTTGLNSTFRGCSSLTTLDVSKWNVTNAVTELKNTFHYMTKVQELDLRSFNVSNVTTISYLCYNDPSIKRLLLDNWDTRNLTDMSFCFSMCNSLQEFDVSKWDVSKVTDMTWSFYLFPMTTLDISGWNTSSLQKMREMFRNCKIKRIIGELDVSHLIASYEAPISGQAGLRASNDGCFTASNMAEMKLKGIGAAPLTKWEMPVNWGLNEISSGAYDSVIYSLYTAAVPNPNLTIRITATLKNRLNSSRTIDGVNSDLSLIQNNKKFIIDGTLA